MDDQDDVAGNRDVSAMGALVRLWESMRVDESRLESFRTVEKDSDRRIQ